MSVALSQPQSAISGAAAEIQPHQRLISGFERAFPLSGGLEGVDAAKPALYKERQWRRAQSRRRCTLSGAVMRAYLLPKNGILRDTRTTSSVDLAVNGRRAQARPLSDRSPPKDI
jgi:hypothetical protein